MPDNLIYVLFGILALSVIIAAIAVIRILYKSKHKRHYTKRDSMLSDAENYFYFLIKDILPDDYILVPQPPVIALLEPVSSEISYRNRIISKRFDFCIARIIKTHAFPHHVLKNIAVIELDDRSHEQPLRQERDLFIEEICAKAELPLLRFKCKSNAHPDYNIQRIKSDILNVINRK